MPAVERAHQAIMHESILVLPISRQSGGVFIKESLSQRAT